MRSRRSVRRPADVAPDTAVLAIDGGRGGALAVAVPHHRAGVRKNPVATVLLLQSGRRRQPDRQVVLLRRDLEASDDHVVGVGAGFRDRLGRRRAGRLLVRAPAARRRGVRSLRQDVNALPRVVLAPIFTLWLGLGIWSKVALGVTLVFFIVFFNVYQGVKEVSRTVLDNGRMLGMSERQLMQHVYWPSALSWMFSSLHTSVGFAVVGAVVGEYLGSAAGLGYVIQQAESVFDVAGVFAGMFVLAVFVILIDFIITLIERRLLVWRPVAADTRT